MELFEYARPDLMSGKKILYLHGFGFERSDGTVKAMGTLLPNAQIIAPDLPVDPHETMQMLRELCAKDKPDLIVGSLHGRHVCGTAPRILAHIGQSSIHAG